MQLPKKIRTNVVYLRILLLEFKLTLGLIALILLAGSLLFHFDYVDRATGARPDYGESLYRTFVLMTMNFPDDFPAHPALRVWCIAVPLISFLVVSEAVVRLAVLLTSKASSGKRWVKAMVAACDNHVILCGMGRLGLSIMRELHRMGKEVVVVDKSEDALGIAEARRLGIPAIIEDARDEQVLVDLGIQRAHSVIAVTDNDLANLEIALDARSLRPGIRVIVRMFDQHIAEKIARSFDIKLVFSPSALAAPSFAAATIDRAVINSFYIDDKQLQTVKLIVRAGSELIGKPLAFLSEGRQLRILSHRRRNREAVLFPPDDTILQEDDKIAILGQSSTLGQLHRLNGDFKK
jgi:voltage-gated potassium channel